MSLAATVWLTSACWMPQVSKPLFMSTVSLTLKSVFLCVWFQWTLVHTYVVHCNTIWLLQYLVPSHAPHHCPLAQCPQLKQILCPFTFWKLEVLLFPCPEMLKVQSSEGQYVFPLHHSTFIVPIRAFPFEECNMKYLKSWLFWMHSLRKHLIL